MESSKCTEQGAVDQGGAFLIFLALCMAAWATAFVWMGISQARQARAQERMAAVLDAHHPVLR